MRRDDSDGSDDSPRDEVIYKMGAPGPVSASGKVFALSEVMTANPVIPSNSSGVYICKSIVNYLRHGNFIPLHNLNSCVTISPKPVTTSLRYRSLRTIWPKFCKRTIPLTKSGLYLIPHISTTHMHTHTHHTHSRSTVYTLKQGHCSQPLDICRQKSPKSSSRNSRNSKSMALSLQSVESGYSGYQIRVLPFLLAEVSGVSGRNLWTGTCSTRILPPRCTRYCKCLVLVRFCFEFHLLVYPSDHELNFTQKKSRSDDVETGASVPVVISAPPERRQTSFLPQSSAGTNSGWLPFLLVVFYFYYILLSSFLFFFSGVLIRLEAGRVMRVSYVTALPIIVTILPKLVPEAWGGVI